MLNFRNQVWSINSGKHHITYNNAPVVDIDPLNKFMLIIIQLFIVRFVTGDVKLSVLKTDMFCL